MFKKGLLLLALFPAIILADVPAELPLSLEGDQIVVNNRILLKINGKPITVVDAVKKMDLIFYRQYPQLLRSPRARFEFYSTNFQYIFSILVNDRLIMADAEEKKVEVTDGDVREEMESLFGPEVVNNIDTIGLSYDEAWDLLKDEIVVRRMNQMMVQSKAINEIQPKEIKALYEEYIKTNPGDDEWHYRILSFKGKDKEAVRGVMERAMAQLKETKPPVDSLHFKEESGVEFSLSTEYQRKDKEISKAHKGMLEKLDPLSYGKGDLQLNNKDNVWAGRIFYLVEHKKGTPPAFKEMEGKLHEELMQKAIARNAESYLGRLRDRYGVTQEYLNQMTPPDFQPFALK